MKYTVKNTAYRGLTETVEEMYIDNSDWNVYLYTSLLSEARVWDTFEKALLYMTNHEMNDHKVVPVAEEDIFEARLKGI